MKQQKLLTTTIEKQLEKHPLGSQDGRGLDADVVVKFFNPYGAGTWLITEGEKQPDGDWLLFGYCHILEWEWGYVSFRELEQTRVKMFGVNLPLERDVYFKGTVRDEVR